MIAYQQWSVIIAYYNFKHSTGYYLNDCFKYFNLQLMFFTGI